MIRKLAKSLQTRLFLGFLAPLLLFLAAAAVGYFSVQRLVNALEREQAGQVVLSEIYDLKESLEAMTAAKRAHHLTGNDEFKRSYDRNHKSLMADVKSLKQKLTEGEPSQRVKTIEALVQQWTANAEPSFNLWKKRENAAMLNPFEWLQKLEEQLNLGKGLVLLKQIHEHIDVVEAAEKDRARQQRVDVVARTNESIWAIATALIVSIVLSIAFSQLLSWNIARPINQLKQSLSAMRQGNFEAITPYGPAEIAELIRGFNLMGIALAERTMVLEAAELRYRTVVGTTSQILWTTDATGKSIDMTDWRIFTGQTDENLIGDGWLEAVHPDDRDRFVRDWRKALERKSYSESEFRIRRADGQFRDFTCRSIPIFDSQEEVSEWVRVCIDVTERKQEEEMRRQRDAAAAANRAKSEFLTKMSHELRTPLNAIIGMSKMLNTQRFGVLNDKQRDYLTDITGAGEHLLDLINDILDLSKVEAGRMALHVEQVPIGDTLEQVVSSVRTLVDGKKLAVNMELPEPDGEIATDPSRFKQVLYNLLSNAVKFTPEKGKVAVRCHWVAGTGAEAPAVSHAEAKALRIDVADTGVGISEVDQEKLGIEFFQADNIFSNTQEGTGLGLALVKRLVELMAGEFWFASEKGQGSTFSFALPRETQDQDTPIAPAQELTNNREARDPSAERPLVLVIDDHKPTNKLLADWLDEAEITATRAFDGPSGLQKARQLKPEAILLDIRLPGMNGFEVLNQLKNDPETANIPVLIVTVLEGQSQFQGLEIVDWLVKPLDKEKLLERMVQLLSES